MGTSLPHLMAPARGHRSSGFTILELLILMVVLGVAASVGIPSYFGRPDVTLTSAAELLARDLREVGGRAAVYREALQLRFDDDGGGYSAADRSGQLLVSPHGAGPFVRRYDVDAVFRGVTIEALEPETPRSVTFDATGTASHSIAVTIGYRGETRVVTLAARTGLIAVDEGPGR
ncbi:MAG: type II secretion system protein [Planctomycetota bacterium]|nr:type II secretion system protein [Planctomycetota bacterium]